MLFRFSSFSFLYLVNFDISMVLKKIILNLPTMWTGLSVSPCNSVSACLKYFEDTLPRYFRSPTETGCGVAAVDLDS